MVRYRIGRNDNFLLQANVALKSMSCMHFKVDRLTDFLFLLHIFVASAPRGQKAQPMH